VKKLNVLADVTLKLRAETPADAQICGEICYKAFQMISAHHNFPSDFPSAAATQKIMSCLCSHPNIYAVVAEVGGRIVGSNFLWEEETIAGVGPLTVSPSIQNAAVGRYLMEALLCRARQQQFDGVRLVQAAYNNSSLALYTKLGFDVQEPLATIQGQALGLETPSYLVRLATAADLKACDLLCQRIHGLVRSRELSQAIRQGTATVVEHGGVITGYATSIGFCGHAVGESNEDLKALISAAKSFEGQGFLLPTRNSELFRWCLRQGFRIVQPMTLMSLGLYRQPANSFLPSILL
jgi:predicted N-acetyltransferase YhbS